MGILDRLLGRSEDSADDDVEGLLLLSGTTTFCREAITSLADRHGGADSCYLELPGSLQRKPNNPADPNDVAVIVEGERIGSLPGYATSAAQVSTIGSRPAQVKIFTEVLPKGLRAEAWAWIGSKLPQ